MAKQQPKPRIRNLAPKRTTAQAVAASKWHVNAVNRGSRRKG